MVTVPNALELLATEIAALGERIAALEHKIDELAAPPEPCRYEARTLPVPMSKSDLVTGAYCLTHGWDCPNVGRKAFVGRKTTAR